MTKINDGGVVPRRYDPAFQEEAVRMWELSGRKADDTAQELGISVAELYQWKRVLRGRRGVGGAGHRGPRTPRR